MTDVSVLFGIADVMCRSVAVPVAIFSVRQHGTEIVSTAGRHKSRTTANNREFFGRIGSVSVNLVTL